jgi:hypothetical protein
VPFKINASSHEDFFLGAEMYTLFVVQAYQYVVPRGGIFIGKWRSTFAGVAGGKINVQSACAMSNR